MTKNKIWIGPRFSDIVANNFFNGAITTYGSNKLSYCNYIQKRIPRGSDEEIAFIEKNIHQFNTNENNNLYILYDQSEIEKINKKYLINIACVNDLSTIKLLNSKEFTRSWLSNDMNCLPFIIMPFSDCSYNQLRSRFPGVTSFIVQNTYGVGGTKTYVISNEKDLNTIYKYNKPYEVCIASPYIQQSISFNIHFICNKNSIIFFPFSTQVITKYNHCLLYSGSDFSQCYSNKIIERIYQSSKTICNKLVKLGYKGICGIDFLWANETLYFIELNPRFQGSTRILDLWLCEQNYPSIYELNYNMFNGISYNYDFFNAHIPYMSYNTLANIAQHNNLKQTSNVIFKDTDGWMRNIDCSDGVYKYRNIYKIIQ